MLHLLFLIASAVVCEPFVSVTFPGAPRVTQSTRASIVVRNDAARDAEQVVCDLAFPNSVAEVDALLISDGSVPGVVSSVQLTEEQCVAAQPLQGVARTICAGGGQVVRSAVLGALKAGESLELTVNVTLAVSQAENVIAARVGMAYANGSTPLWTDAVDAAASEWEAHARFVGVFPVMTLTRWGEWLTLFSVLALVPTCLMYVRRNKYPFQRRPMTARTVGLVFIVIDAIARSLWLPCIVVGPGIWLLDLGFTVGYSVHAWNVLTEMRVNLLQRKAYELAMAANDEKQSASGMSASIHEQLKQLRRNNSWRKLSLIIVPCCILLYGLQVALAYILPRPITHPGPPIFEDFGLLCHITAIVIGAGLTVLSLVVLCVVILIFYRLYAKNTPDTLHLKQEMKVMIFFYAIAFVSAALGSDSGWWRPVYGAMIFLNEVFTVGVRLVESVRWERRKRHVLDDDASGEDTTEPYEESESNLGDSESRRHRRVRRARRARHREIRRLRKSDPQAAFLLELASRRYRVAFAQFLEGEFATENLLFIDSVRRLQIDSDNGTLLANDQLREFSQLIDAFVGDNAPMQVNLPFKLSEQLLASKQAGEMNRAALDASFGNIINMLLTDLVPRFIVHRKEQREGTGSDSSMSSSTYLGDAVDIDERFGTRHNVFQQSAKEALKQSARRDAEGSGSRKHAKSDDSDTSQPPQPSPPPAEQTARARSSSSPSSSLSSAPPPPPPPSSSSHTGGSNLRESRRVAASRRKQSKKGRSRRKERQASSKRAD